jgi:MFS family permease
LLRRVFTAFQYRDFRLMWVGACTSSVGTWMQKLAQSWLVLQLSNSPFMLGLDSFLGEIPIFLFALVAGVVADRIDRRRLLVISQVVQLTCAFVLAALFAMGKAQVWHILSLSFVVGTAQSFGAPAYQALLPGLVPKDHLSNAIAMNSIQFNLARVIGPVLGGFALAHYGAAWCFGLNGLSYLAVIATLLMIQAGFRPTPTKEPLLESMKGGIDFIRHNEAMGSLIVVAFLMTFFGIPLIVFLPVFAKNVYGGGVGTFTILQSVEGVGAIAGALMVAGRAKTRRLGRDAVLSLTLLGAMTAAFALSTTIPMACVFLFLGGVALINCFALISSLVQLIATDEMRGRVMSVYNIAFRGGMPLGSLTVGALIKSFGAPPVIAASGCILAAIGLYLMFAHRKVAAL